MKTMKWLMMCMLAIGACCLSACGDDDESIRLTPTDENQQPISSDYTLQLSPFSEGESYYIYGAETPFTIENSNKEVVEVIEGNSTLTFKPLLQGESIISIRDAKSHVYFLKIKVAYPSRSFHVIGLRAEVIGDEITQKEERELSERILKNMHVSLDGEYFFSYMVPDSTEGEVIIYPSSTAQAQKGTFQQEVKYDENGKTYQQLSIQLTSGEKFYYALSVSGTTQTITSADYDEWSLSANTDSLVYGLKEDITEKYQTDYPKLEKAYATQFIQ